MNIPLTDNNKAYLRKKHRKLRDRRDADKIKAVMMFSDGYAIAEISSVLILDDDTVRTWIKAYEDGEDVDKWLVTNYVAYQGKLSEEEEAVLIEYIDSNVISDSKKVNEFIEKKFCKKYSLSGITSLLKRLGFVYKKTTLVPSKYDPVQQASFKAIYEELEVELKTSETILFMDGVHPQHNTTCTSAWIKKGKVKGNKE